VSQDSEILSCEAGDLGRITGQDEKMFLQEVKHGVTAVPVYL
jgi:hypothetical protein